MLLQNTSASRQRSFAFLAPRSATLDGFVGDIQFSESSHADLLSQMQRLRGRIYLEDGAIDASELDDHGCHVSPVDVDSWHLLTLDRTGRVLGCTRFRQHPNSVSFDELTVRHASIAQSELAGMLEACINAELESARRARFCYVEVGGWALAEELRGTTEAFYSVLATYAWSELQGGALGLSTATERNGSASILRRLGGVPLQHDGAALPPYYDPQYRCGMELIRFDSRSPNPKYAALIKKMRSEIAAFPVFCNGRPIPRAEPKHHSGDSIILSMEAVGVSDGLCAAHCAL